MTTYSNSWDVEITKTAPVTAETVKVVTPVPIPAPTTMADVKITTRCDRAMVCVGGVNVGNTTDPENADRFIKADALLMDLLDGNPEETPDVKQFDYSKGARVKIPLVYLQKIFAIVKKMGKLDLTGEAVTISANTDYPLKLEFTGNNGGAWFIIAPRVSED